MASSDDDIAALEALGRLRDSNVLTDDEFQEQKARILSSDPKAKPVRAPVKFTALGIGQVRVNRPQAVVHERLPEVLTAAGIKRFTQHFDTGVIEGRTSSWSSNGMWVAMRSLDLDGDAVVEIETRSPGVFESFGRNKMIDTLLGALLEAIERRESLPTD